MRQKLVKGLPLAEQLRETRHYETRDILRLTALGFTVQEIASFMGLSTRPIMSCRKEVSEFCDGTHILVVVAQLLQIHDKPPLDLEQCRDLGSEAVERQEQFEAACKVIAKMAPQVRSQLRSWLLSESARQPHQARMPVGFSKITESFVVVLMAAVKQGVLSTQDLPFSGASEVRQYQLAEGVKVTVSIPTGQNVRVRQANNSITIEAD